MRSARLLLAVALLAGACHSGSPDRTGWIQGPTEQRWDTVERQLRGLDVAMIEIGYRYQELYFAALEANWEYAAHQLEHMEIALANALERRPQRRASAQAHFLPSLHGITRVVEAQQHERFEAAFSELTAACNACHTAEGVASFRVEVPAHRPSPIGAPR
jgi:hypothetical protein